MAVSFQVGFLPNQSPSVLLKWCRTAEELGFDGLWMADSQSIFREAFALLAAAATQTERIKLASGVTNPITRHPSVLASYFATLDELSAGRAILGIGVGESSVHTLGLRPARLKKLEEAIVVLKALMRGEEAKWNGESFRLTWPRRDVPIFMACSGPKSLQLGGRVADGVLFQVGSSPELVTWAIEQIQRGADSAGRNLKDIRLYCRLACTVASDRAQAREEGKGYVAAAAGTVFGSVPKEVIPGPLWADLKRMKQQYDYYEHASSEAQHKAFITDTIVDSISISGTPAEAVPRFLQLLEVGVEGFVLPVTSKEPVDLMRSLARDVIPQVQTTAGKKA